MPRHSGVHTGGPDKDRIVLLDQRPAPEAAQALADEGRGTPQPEDWADLTRLVDLLGTDRFERELYDFVSKHISLSVLFAIELRDDGHGGRVLVTEGADGDLTERARKISRDYAESDYATDEVFMRHSHGPPGAMEMVLQHATDRQGSFRLKYFDDMDTTEEISSFSRQIGGTLYLGYSSTVAGFSVKEIARIKKMSPLLTSLVARHTALVDAAGVNLEVLRERRLDTLRRVLVQHEAGLTTREADVCAAIVIGYRTDAIAVRLDISPNTVATHRKRAYAKLNISSQTELFGIFFAGWAS